MEDNVLFNEDKSMYLKNAVSAIKDLQKAKKFSAASRLKQSLIVFLLNELKSLSVHTADFNLLSEQIKKLDN